MNACFIMVAQLIAKDILPLVYYQQGSYKIEWVCDMDRSVNTKKTFIVS